MNNEEDFWNKIAETELRLSDLEVSDETLETCLDMLVLTYQSREHYKNREGLLGRVKDFLISTEGVKPTE